MSDSIPKKLTPVVIFDRNNPAASDVPIFSQALKQKVNTPIDSIVSDGLSIKTQAILAQILSSSRADSSGGQTGGFAQGEEKTEQVVLYEEPTLDRSVATTPIISIPELPVVIAPSPVPVIEALPEVLIPDPVFFEPKVGKAETIWKWALPKLNYISHEFPKLMLVWELGVDGMYALMKKHISTGKRIIQEKRVTQSMMVASVKEKVSISLPVLRPSISPFEKIGRVVIGGISKVGQKISSFNFYAIASRTMIAASLVLMLLTVGPMVALQMQSWKEQISYSLHTMSSKADDSQETLAPEATATPAPTPNPDPDKQFQISIPKIGVNSKVIANVDASNETDYDAALKKGVAHAAGTGLPGEENKENKTIFIFGHSTNGTWNIARYNALFYSLKDMSVGDSMSVWFWGKEFHYTVSETKIVEANDVSFLIPQTTTDQLILQTCWPPGTSWKRFLVIAHPDEN
ncbi:MAG: sortase [Candidatus Woesebacteria bacterium]